MLGTYCIPSKYFNVNEFLIGRSTSYAWFMSRSECTLYSTIFVPRTKPWFNTETVKKENRELIPATIGTFQFCIVPPRTILFCWEPPNTTSPRTSNPPVTVILSTSPSKSWRFPVVITVPDTSGSNSKRSEEGTIAVLGENGESPLMRKIANHQKYAKHPTVPDFQKCQ